MEVLYQSKGISKSALITKLVSITLSLVIAIGLLTLAASKVTGPMQTSVIGGLNGYHVTTRPTHYRFDSEERKGIESISYFFAVVALIDVVQLAIAQTSWIEIRSDAVHGGFAGKTISCPTNRITSVTSFGNCMIISGTFGKSLLIAKNQKMAINTLNSLLMERNHPTGRYAR